MNEFTVLYCERIIATTEQIRQTVGLVIKQSVSFQSIHITKHY